MALSHRENYLRTVNFQNPEYIPGGVGVRDDGWHKYGARLTDLYEKYFGNRVYEDDKIPHPDSQFIKDGEYHRIWTDEWGCVMEEKIFGIHPIIVGFPLADWKALETYQTPPGPSMAAEEIEAERKSVAQAKANGGFVIQHFLRLFERMQWLRGYEQLMLDFIEKPPELQRMADIIVEHNLLWVKRSIAVGADAVGFSDDWGAQDALMIKPETWREFYKPLYKRMFDPILDAGMMIHFHSDGYILDILPDLKELGVNIVNPQTNCHDLKALGETSRDLRLCVNADMDRQGVLSFGKPSDIKQYFQRVVDTIGGADGGLMFSVECGSDTPFENIEAAMQAVIEYRDYPSRLRDGN